MTILYSTGEKPYKLPKSETYDPDEKRFYSASYRPKSWVADKEYLQGVDVVIPASANGFYYECSSSGVSGATEPVFATTDGSTTADNTVQWQAIAYNLLLRTGDTITASTWTGVNGETVDNESIVGGSQTRFRLLTVPTDATTATLKNHITVTRLNGDVEEFDRSLIIPVKQL